MNKRLKDILTQIMGTGSTVSGCSPSSVHIHKSDRLRIEAVNELINLGVVTQIGTRCEGDVLVFGSAWDHFHGERQAAKRAGLD